MTTYYDYPDQLAEKWADAGASEDRSRSVSRNPPNQNNTQPISGLKKRFISLKLSNLPKSITIPQLWKAFSPKGNIEFIELLDSRPHETCAVGLIAFAPPPEIEFWNGKRLEITFHGHDEPVTVYVGVQQVRHESRQTEEEQRCPSIISMPLNSLDFGSLADQDTMVIEETIQSVEEDDILLELHTRKGEITMYFQFPEKQRHFTRKRQYKIVTQVSAIKKAPDVLGIMPADSRRWHYNDGWIRATDIYEFIIESQKYPISTYSRGRLGKCIDISRLRTFRCVINEGDAKSRTTVEHLLLALDQYNINPARTTLKLAEDKSSMWDLLDYQEKSSSNTLEYLGLTAHDIYLDFAVRYRLEVCVTRGYLSEYAIGAEFLEKLAALDPPKASHILEYVADQELNIEDPLQIFQDPQFRCAPPKSPIPHYCSLVLKANITPTSLKLNLPNVESSNRVMRKYNNLQDRFLRVQFLSETESDRIAKDQQQNNDDIWKRLLRVLHKGIRIGERTYEFLAFGNSQLREGSVTFFCPTAHISCDDIRKWLGNFNHIRNIAKFGARIGQCFSTTREVRGVRVPTVRIIEDIESKGECFSDGVGIISELLAKLVVGEMKLDVVGNPSAFQFRMGGAKGVLAVWPKEYAKHMEVCLRGSQIKFSTEANTLEIVKCAKTTTATLNRQIITVLEHLGVPSDAFMALLNKHIQHYEEAITNRQVAIDLLTRFVDENQTTVILAELLKANFQDPFVKNLLRLWRSWSLKLMKEKCRIHVEASAFVMGCIDETGTLRGHSLQTEGSRIKDVSVLPQIFLQISDRKYRNKTTIIRGVCLIGRNPSLHAGDIRIVQAVDIPALHHLKDVVVFPCRGDRPLPISSPRFGIPPPMHSSPVTPENLNRDVMTNDLRNFVVQYMKSDVLGLIAISHLAHADKLGLNSSTCLQLAELHSRAVDYPKTGVPAEWNRAKYSPKFWPHFMQRKSRNYHSKRALGKLYDRVADENFDYVPNCEDEFDSRIAEKFDFTDEILTTAKSMKNQYDITVRRLMKQFRIATEFELYSGWAMSKPAVGSDYKRQEDLGQQFDTLKQRFRDLCAGSSGDGGGSKFDRLVAAIYKVTQDEVKEFLGDAEAEGEDLEFSPKTMPLISFPWIFHWSLIKIAMGHSFKPSETTLAGATRLVPVVVPNDTMDRLETNAQLDMEQTINFNEKTSKPVHLTGGTDLMEFPIERSETKLEASCSTPEAGNSSESPCSAQSFETVPTEPDSGEDSFHTAESRKEASPDAILLKVAAATQPSWHLDYRESAVDRLLRLYDDSEED
ncbi:hypothetical protein NLG97_g4076 [Lecanicillium saksenae]|uniref:Uncharacterized protein n=1 Tax=Lecanicillium saksenae TaxID=468837 RepID=A0ACC1QWB2_9HYPO|nr:hypothetical protein NLG97_g4076 [Lecanicillium saksenae]